MMRCFAPGDRNGALVADRGDIRHQGSENSALKNRAPSSLTARKTSERRSIYIASLNWAFLTRITDAESSSRACRGRQMSMNATIQPPAQPNADFDALKSRLKTTWMTGDYDRF